MKCPECDSDNVLVGSGDNPHHCSECEHEWQKEQMSETVLFKSPEKYLTFNMDLRRKSRIVQRINDSLQMESFNDR